jgi:hypothetical protein
MEVRLTPAVTPEPVPPPAPGLASAAVPPDRQAHLLTNLTGRPYQAFLGDPGAQAPWERATAARPMTVAVNYAGAPGSVEPHYVTVQGFHAGPPGTVELANTQGGTVERLSVEALRAHLIGGAYPRA